MSFLLTVPDMVTTAAQDLAGIQSTLTQATAAAAGPTTGVVAAAQDEISSGIASVFGSFGREFHAVSARAQAFHEQFVNLLNSGGSAYLGTEAENAEQALANAVDAPVRALPGQSLLGAGAGLRVGISAATSNVSGIGATIAKPYQSLIANTTANLQAIENAWVNSTAPVLLRTLITQTGYPQQFLAALETGNLSSVMALTGHIGQSYANVIQELTVPASLSVTALSPSTATLAIGLGLPELLAIDAMGAPINAATAFMASSAAFFGAMQAGNPLAAAVALIDAPANIANAFLNGQETLSLPLPLGGLSVTAPVPFSGLLVPLQPFSTTTTTVAGSPILQTITITAPPIGGLIPALVDYAPELIATALGT